MDNNLHKKHFHLDIQLSLTSLKSEGMPQEQHFTDQYKFTDCLSYLSVIFAPMEEQLQKL